MNKHRHIKFGVAALCVALLQGSAAYAAPAAPPVAAPQAETPAVVTDNSRPNRMREPLHAYHPATDLPAPAHVVTHHSITVHGQKIPFTAVAGDTFVTNLSSDVIGSFFSFAYIKDAPKNSNRPVIFVFNGGPGAASVWLHMGVMGPWRVKMSSSVNPSVVPPFILEDNPDCLLDVADVVFVDPVGTGFSRILGVGKPSDFFGVDEDQTTVAQFMEKWLTKNDRWNSPKYLVGESYGSYRAAILPRALMGGPNYMGIMRGVTINGIVLLGTALTEGPEVSAEARLWHEALNLPGEAAATWYHKRGGQGMSLPDYFESADRYARTDYFAALQKGAAGKLPDGERDEVAKKLAGFLGISPKDIPKDLKLSGRAFASKVLEDKGQIIGAYDSRYTLPSLHVGTDSIADDPAMGQYVPPFLGAFHQMLNQKLTVDLDRPYYSINWSGANNGWNWRRAGAEKGQSAAVDLAVGMRRNQKMKVLVGAGYYDLNSAAAAARHDLEVAELPTDRYKFKFYESGHMLYVGETAGAFADDIRELIRSTQ